jgi:hypothetical protein
LFFLLNLRPVWQLYSFLIHARISRSSFKRRKNETFHTRNTSEPFAIMTTATESPKSVFHTESQLQSLNLPLPFGHIYRNFVTACPYLTPSNLSAARPHNTRESQIHSVPVAAARAAFLAFLLPRPEQLPTSPCRRPGEVAARRLREVLRPPP